MSRPVYVTIPRIVQRAGEFDVLAIGAGPAGATVAHLLARWGYRVALVERARSQPHGLAVALPPSATKLLQRFGLAGALAGRHVLAATGNTSWWGQQPCRSESFAHPGHQVHRPGFDRALVSHARRSGAVVRTGTAVKRIHVCADEAEIEWRADDDRRGRWRARFVLDCSGRAGVVARRGLRRPPLYQTQALVGFWRHPSGFPLPASADRTHTLAESYHDGWAWSVPISPRVRIVTLMTSAQRTTYQRELVQVPHHAALVDGATLVARPWTTDASAFDACRYADGPVLIVGDAGSGIDPLSSFGVKKAMMSAWRAAVVVNTVLRGGEAAGDALGYFTRSEHEMFAQALDGSREFFHAAATAHGGAFWPRRADAVEARVGARGAATGSDGDRVRHDPDVAQAWRTLRDGSRLRLEPRSDVTIEPIVEPDGRMLVRRPALAMRSLKAPIRYVAGVELPRLFSLASSYGQVPDLYEAYNRAVAPVALPDFLGALSVLIAKGALIQQVDA